MKTGTGKSDAWPVLVFVASAVALSFFLLYKEVAGNYWNQLAMIVATAIVWWVMFTTIRRLLINDWPLLILQIPMLLGIVICGGYAGEFLPVPLWLCRTIIFLPGAGVIAYIVINSCAENISSGIYANYPMPNLETHGSVIPIGIVICGTILVFVLSFVWDHLIPGILAIATVLGFVIYMISCLNKQETHQPKTAH